MPLGGAKHEHFSCFSSSCQCGLTFHLSRWQQNSSRVPVASVSAHKTSQSTINYFTPLCGLLLSTWQKAKVMTYASEMG